MEVSISEVKQRLINRQPPVSRHLRAKKHLQSFRGKAFSLLSELQQIYDRAFQISASPWQPVLGLEVEMNDSSAD